MSFALEDLLEGVRVSRKQFLKHLRGLGEEQWDWKPYAVAYLTAEDFYHSAQAAFIRMATDPGWDYYGSIYRGE